MIVAREIAALRRAVAGLVRPVALVPTMGALHAGHLALVAAARAEGGSVVASIFVNPLQFAATEDLARYPRDEAGDLAALERAGCGVVWMPPVATMYQAGACTVIDVGGPSAGFEGTARPGYFRGVATVVGKLLHQVGPEAAVFGEKDWQQLQVVRRMVADLDWPVRVVAVPTVREADGLAMSSRNRFLTAAERGVASGLYPVLREVAAGLPVAAGEQALRRAGMEPEYLARVDNETLQPWASGPGRLLAVVRLGSLRLLDNVAVA